MFNLGFLENNKKIKIRETFIIFNLYISKLF